MVITGIPMAIDLARRGLPPGDPLAFLLLLLGDLLSFALFVGVAIRVRRRSDTHKRLMLLAMISLMPPAISRWPIAVTRPWVIPVVVLLLVAVTLLYDLRTPRRFHPASLWGGVALVVSLPLRFIASQSSGWHHIASWLIR
jgi:hypothetical protein